MTQAETNEVRRMVREAGYSEGLTQLGIAYAHTQGASDAKEGFILAVSRILYSDAQLAGGARFAAEA